MIFDKILISQAQPNRNDIAWAKPVEGGFALYLPYNGKWQPMKVMDDLSTVTPDDDEVSAISKIPELIKEEVTTQLGNHDEDVRDTHNADTTDDTEYPDVIFY